MIEGLSMTGIHIGLNIIMLYIVKILDNLQNAPTYEIIFIVQKKTEEYSLRKLYASLSYKKISSGL